MKMFRREMSWFEIIIKAIIAILLLILGFGLGGCATTSTSSEGNVDEVNSSETVTEVEDTSVIVEEVVEVKSESTEKVLDPGSTIGELTVLGSLKESLEDTDIAEVWFENEDNAYIIYPKTLSDDIRELANGTGDIDSWNELVDLFGETSKYILLELGEGYSFFIANPVSEDKYIVGFVDGILLFDFVSEAYYEN